MYPWEITAYVHKTKQNKTKTKTLYKNVHIRLIWNNQKQLKDRPITINRRLDNWFAVCSYNRTLFSNRREWATDTQNNLDESQRHYAEGRKPDIEESKNRQKLTFSDRNVATMCIDKQGTTPNITECTNHWSAGICHLDLFFAKLWLWFLI